MTLKYRIKRRTYPFADAAFFAQYRILGMWLYINHKGSGRFTTWASGTYCESLEEARERIKRHKNNMQRADEAVGRCTKVIERL